MIDMTEQYRAPEPPQADKDWFGGRRWTGIAAIAVILLIVVLVAFLIANRHHASPKATTPTTGPASSVAGSLSSAPAADQAVPTAAPAGIAWSLYQSVALPRSSSAGPSRFTGDAATGYAHTPVGALIAAANIIYRYGLAPDADWRAATDAMIAPGVGRDAWTRLRAANNYGTRTQSGGTYAQIAGFQFVSYTSTDAVVQIVTRDSSGTLQVGTHHVTWQGDWKLVLAPDGSATATSQVIASLAGFVQWGGV